MGWVEDMLAPQLGGAPPQDPFAYLQGKGTVGLGTPQLQDPMKMQAMQARPSVRPAAAFDPIAQAQNNAGLEAQAIRQGIAAETAQDSEVAEKTALAEAQRAREDREHEEARTRLYSDVDRRQREIIDEAAQQQKIDPGKFAKDLGTGGAIAAAATGFLSGLINPKGGADDVVQLITGLADRSVQAQLQNQAQRDKLLGLKQQALAGDTARGRDLLDAQLAATARAYDGAIKLVKAEATKKWGGQIGEAKANGLIAGIQQKFVAFAETVRDTRINQGTARMNAESQRISAETGRAAQQEVANQNKAENALKEADLGIKAAAKGSSPIAGLTPKEARELEIHGADGKVVGYGYSSEDAKAVRNQVIGYEDFRTDLQDYKDLLEKHGRETDGLFGVGQTEARSVLEGKHSRLMTTLKSPQFAALGVLAGPDLDLLLKQIPAPRGTFGGVDPLPAVTEALNHADQAMDRFINARVQGAKGYRSVTKPLPGEVRGGTDADRRVMDEPGLSQSAPRASMTTAQLIEAARRKPVK